MPRSELEKPSVNEGYELRVTQEKGEGVFATRSFKRDDIVMTGDLVEVAKRNTTWTTQVC